MGNHSRFVFKYVLSIMISCVYLQGRDIGTVIGRNESDVKDIDSDNDNIPMNPDAQSKSLNIFI